MRTFPEEDHMKDKTQESINLQPQNVSSPFYLVERSGKATYFFFFLRFNRGPNLVQGGFYNS